MAIPICMGSKLVISITIYRQAENATRNVQSKKTLETIPGSFFLLDSIKSMISFYMLKHAIIDCNININILFLYVSMQILAEVIVMDKSVVFTYFDRKN